MAFEVSQQSELARSGLSHVLESHHLSDQSSHGAASLLEDADGQPSRVSSRDITRNTSLSQRTGVGAGGYSNSKSLGKGASL
jgi:hypothetical protein